MYARSCKPPCVCIPDHTVLNTCACVVLHRVLSTHNSDVRRSKEPESNKQAKSAAWWENWETDRKCLLYGLF